MNSSVFLVALLCGMAACTQFSDCGSAASDVTFTVAGCNTPPCTVKLGSRFPVSISFTPDESFPQLTANVYAIIGGYNAPWPRFDSNGCKYMVGEQCPLKQSEKATWTYEVYADPKMIRPFVNQIIDTQWQLNDGNKNQVCAGIPVYIQD